MDRPAPPCRSCHRRICNDYPKRMNQLPLASNQAVLTPYATGALGSRIEHDSIYRLDHDLWYLGHLSALYTSTYSTFRMLRRLRRRITTTSYDQPDCLEERTPHEHVVLLHRHGTYCHGHGRRDHRDHVSVRCQFLSMVASITDYNANLSCPLHGCSDLQL